MKQTIKTWAGGLLVTLALKGEKAMTKEFVMQVVRDGLKVFGASGLGVALGVGADEWTILGSAAAIVIGVVWGFIARKDANAKK